MKKGQYFVLEQMLLFAIGVVITVALYFSLTGANESVKNLSEEDQMYEVGNLVYSGINRVYLNAGETQLTVDIPKKISGEGYKIYVEKTASESNLIVKLKKRVVKIPINSEYNATGMLFSSGGIVGIRKMKEKILIGRFPWI